MTRWATGPATNCCKWWPGGCVGILRASDTVGRLGGDEFVILAEGVSLAGGPEMIAERVHEVLKPAVPHPGGRRAVHHHLGQHRHRHRAIATTAEELLRDADIALYRAKGAGRDQSVLFEREMQSAAKERLALKSDLEIGARPTASSSCSTTRSSISTY